MADYRVARWGAQQKSLFDGLARAGHILLKADHFFAGERIFLPLFLPTPKEEAERCALHAKLDVIAGKLMESREPSARRNLSDNFGASKCGTLHDSCKLADLLFPS